MQSSMSVNKLNIMLIYGVIPFLVQASYEIKIKLLRLIKTWNIFQFTRNILTISLAAP